MRERGQIFSFDLLGASLIFLLIIGMLLISSAQTSQSVAQTAEENERDEAAMLAASALVRSTGNPGDWHVRVDSSNPSYRVSGAGTGSANQDYSANGTHNGKTIYTGDSNSTLSIYWSLTADDLDNPGFQKAAWVIGDVTMEHAPPDHDMLYHDQSGGTVLTPTLGDYNKVKGSLPNATVSYGSLGPGSFEGVSAIGLAESENLLDPDKVQELVDLNATGYNQVKNFLGLAKFDVGISVIRPGTLETLYMFGVFPSAKKSSSATRFVSLDGEEVMLRVRVFGK